jgi:hypothetical protein
LKTDQLQNKYLKDTCGNVENKLCHKCLEIFKTHPTFVSAQFLKKLASGDFYGTKKAVLKYSWG